MHRTLCLATNLIYGWLEFGVARYREFGVSSDILATNVS